MRAGDEVVEPRIDRALRRDGFTALYDRHVDEVYRFVHRCCLDQPLAEDVTQDTFLSAVRTWQDPGEVTVGWLIQVARNRMLDVLRQRARHDRKLRLLDGGEPTSCEAAAVPDRLEVRAALERLSVEHRTVLTLHYVHGFTVPALAEELGRSLKAVEGLVTRARRNLRRELEARDGR